MNIVIIRSKVAVKFFPIDYIEYMKWSDEPKIERDGSGRSLGRPDVSAPATDIPRDSQNHPAKL